MSYPMIIPVHREPSDEDIARKIREEKEHSDKLASIKGATVFSVDDEYIVLDRSGKKFYVDYIDFETEEEHQQDNKSITQKLIELGTTVLGMIIAACAIAIGALALVMVMGLFCKFLMFPMLDWIFGW